MIRFNSDYTEGCHPAILRRLEETNMEQTAGYGEDEYCREAAERIKAVCEAPDANVHFLVGGTQTNVTVIASALRPYQGAITATTGHINVHETGAVEACGYKCLTVDTPDGKLTAEQVEKYTKAHFADESLNIWYSRNSCIFPIRRNLEPSIKRQNLRRYTGFAGKTICICF